MSAVLADASPAPAPAAPPSTSTDPLDDVRVPAIGTMRRLRALAVIGWPMTILEGWTGITAHTLRLITHGGCQTVTARAEAGLRLAYDLLWDQPGPSAAARSKARALGWAPAMAWDDDLIDDPAAVPQGIRPARMPRAERIAGLLEDSDWLLDKVGLTLGQAADRLGVSRNYLEKVRHRHGRYLQKPPCVTAAAGSSTVCAAACERMARVCSGHGPARAGERLRSGHVGGGRA
jgi:hypothetical protein